MKRFKQMLSEGMIKSVYTPESVEQIYQRLEEQIENKNRVDINEIVNYMIQISPGDREYIRKEINEWRGPEDDSLYLTLKQVFEVI